MRIQEYLEETVQDLLEARTYISTNTIPVVRYSDFNTDREGLCVVVRVSSVNRVAPNYDKYECVLEVSPVTLIESDIERVNHDALFDDVQDFAYQDMTVLALQTGADAISLNYMTIDGVVNTDTDELDNEDFYINRTNTNVYITYTP